MGEDQDPTPRTHPAQPSSDAGSGDAGSGDAGWGDAGWGDSARLPDPGYELLPPVERGPNLPKPPAQPRVRPTTRRLQSKTDRIVRRKTSRRQRRASQRLKHSTGSGLLPYGSSATVHPDRSRSASSQRHVASRPMPAALLAALPLLLLVVGGLVLLNGSQPTHKRAPRETTAPAIRTRAQARQPKASAEERPAPPAARPGAQQPAQAPSLPPTPARPKTVKDQAEVSPDAEKERLEAWAERERELQRREDAWLQDLRREQAEDEQPKGEQPADEAQPEAESESSTD